jgi:hypothetical protein
MVAVIKFSSSLRNVLNYNEQKCQQEIEILDEHGQKKKLHKAEMIHANGFAKDTDKLGFTDKMHRLRKQMDLNETRKKSVVHISLNFDPSEKLDKNSLQSIANTYMEKIGFGNQPYVVYEHRDAGHPHIHIVSTIIQNNGRPIETHNIGKLVSDPARKLIEQQYGLVVADEHKQKEAFRIKPVDAQKVQYGKSDTRRQIINVLDFVLPNYKVFSIGELNAVLQQYNVMADQGSEKSRIYKNRGLVYRALDAHGNKIGVPIKASDIYNKPGLDFLEQCFSTNASFKQPHHKQRIKNAIHLALAHPATQTLDDFQKKLRQDRIQLVTRYTQEGKLYGVTFIDHKSKVVFKGSDLDKNYSAAGFQRRFANVQQRVAKTPVQDTTHITAATGTQHADPIREKQAVKAVRTRKAPLPPATAPIPSKEHPASHLHDLLKPEYVEPIPAGLRPKKKRKKKKRLNI